MWRSMFSRISSWFWWMLGMSKKTTKLSPVVYQVIHVLLVIVIAALLAYFSPRILDESNVPTAVPFISRYFCGIFFLLLYAFVRFVIYLIGLFGVQEFSEFEDIDRAWASGLDALARSGFDLQESPVFLVIGLTEGEEVGHFAAKSPRLATGGLGWNVSPGPDDRGAVLRFYANDEAVFISCPGVGVMSRQLKATQQADLSVSPEQPENQKTLTRDEIEATQTVIGPMLSAGHTLVPGQAGRTMLPPGPGGRVPTHGIVQAPPTLSNQEVTEARRRLEYLCRLISRERGPFCPINGLQVVVPLDWSKSSKLQSLYKSTKQDVETLHSAFELQFPLVCVFSGLEEFSGISEFIDRGCQLNSRFRDSRAGSHFPLGHGIDDHASQWVIDKGLHWFRGWIYSAFAKDLANPDNTKLYRLLCDLDERRPRLVRQLTLSFGDLADGTTVWLSGCYFTACGEGNRQRAFVQGVLQKLIGEQNNVAWSESRLERERRCRAWAYGLFGLATFLAVVDCGLLLLRLWWLRGPSG